MDSFFQQHCLIDESDTSISFFGERYVIENKILLETMETKMNHYVDWLSN